jgi:hypothetical protein
MHSQQAILFLESPGSGLGSKRSVQQNQMGKSTRLQEHQMSFFIHLWLEGEEAPAWRGRVNDGIGGHSRAFEDEQALLSFIRERLLGVRHAAEERTAGPRPKAPLSHAGSIAGAEMGTIIQFIGCRMLAVGIAGCATNQLGPVRPTLARRGVQNSCRCGTIEKKPTRLCVQPSLGRRRWSAKSF